MVGFSSSALNIVPGKVAPTTPYIANRLFRLRAGARAFPVSPPWRYSDCLGPKAIQSPNGRYLLLNTRPRHSPPRLELLDTRAGSIRVFERSACAPAWSSKGQIAYLRLDRYRANSFKPVVGRIVVQQGLTGSRVTWSRGDFGPLMWAGPVLLSASETVTTGNAALRMLRRPGRASPVNVGPAGRSPYVEGSSTSVVAVNPSGTRVLLDVEKGFHGFPRDFAMLLRVRDGRVVSRLLLPDTGTALASDGDWLGDRIVTTDAVYPGLTTHPPAALITLGVHRDGLRLVSERGFEYKGRPIPLQSFPSVFQARFLDSDRQKVAMWFGPLAPQLYLQCNLKTLICLAGQGSAQTLIPSIRAEGSFVSNPSRP